MKARSHFYGGDRTLHHDIMKTSSQVAGPGRNEIFFERAVSPVGGAPALRGRRFATHGLPSYRIVLAPLLSYDPMNINYEVGMDAYLPESETILARLGGCPDADAVDRVVHEELRGSFGPDAVDSGRRYEQVAREIWERWEDSVATPRIEAGQAPRPATARSVQPSAFRFGPATGKQ
jgi:hypothetical protein